METSGNNDGTLGLDSLKSINDFIKIEYRFEQIYESSNVYGVAVSATGSEVFVIISQTSHDKIMQVSFSSNPKKISMLAESCPLDSVHSRKRFKRLKDIVLSPDDHLWVTDYYNYGVHKIDLEGKDVLIFAGDFGESNGTATETQFKYPTSICCDDAGTVYILDYIVSNLRRITDDKSYFVHHFESGTRYDTCIAYDKKEHCIFLSFKASIQQYFIQQQTVQMFANSEGSLLDADFYGIAVDPCTGNVYVINDTDKSIYSINRETRKFSKVEAFSNTGLYLDLSTPVRLRTDQNGVLYVADQKEGIFKITPKKRLAWFVKRLLWIGLLKEKSNDCFLAQLPRDILSEIIGILEA